MTVRRARRARLRLRRDRFRQFDLQELEPRLLLAAGGLSFLSVPSSSASGAPMAPVQVQVLDTSGQPDSSSTDPVTIALAQNPGGASLDGTVTVNAVNGVATFSNLQIDTSIPTQGFALVATSGNATSPPSSPLLVTPGPYQLAFTSKFNTNVKAGASLGNVTVQVEDQNDLPVSVNGSPQVTLYLKTNATGATLQGTTTATLVDGKATFTGLSITKTGDYSLGVSSPTAATSFLMPGVSTDITVTNAAPATVAFVTPPLDVDTGQPINAGLNPAGVSVSVLDAYGNPVLDSQPVVTMALAASSNPGKLTGTTAVQAVAGVATFKDLSIDAGGTSYALDASLEGSAPVASAPFNVGVGTAPTHLVFTQMATSIVPDGGNLPKIVVSVEDTNGHVVQDDNTTQVTIKLAIPAGGLGGNLYGVLTEPVQNGVAVFDKLYIQQVALQGKTSTSFNLVASSTNHTSLATATTSFDVGVRRAGVVHHHPGGQPAQPSGRPAAPADHDPARRLRWKPHHQEPGDERLVRRSPQWQRRDRLDQPDPADQCLCQREQHAPAL